MLQSGTHTHTLCFQSDRHRRYRGRRVHQSYLVAFTIVDVALAVLDGNDMKPQQDGFSSSASNVPLLRFSPPRGGFICPRPPQGFSEHGSRCWPLQCKALNIVCWESCSLMGSRRSSGTVKVWFTFTAADQFPLFSYSSFFFSIERVVSYCENPKAKLRKKSEINKVRPRPPPCRYCRNLTLTPSSVCTQHKPLDENFLSLHR